jgi:hypothetical protein
MPYVVRDKNGCVVSVIANPNGGNGESRLKADDKEINAYFDKGRATRELQEVLVASDLSFVRVLEDLISALLDKGVIMLTDLPEAAQEKILQRQDIRANIANLGALIDDVTEEDELML